MKVKKFISNDYFSCNCYVCSINNINFIVDPGCYNKKMKEYIDSINGISFILCTHGHYDHIGSIDEIISDYPNTKIYAFEDELDVIYSTSKNLASHCLDRTKEFRKYVPSPNIIGLMEGNNIIEGISFNLYHTPGHTKGSAIFHFYNEKAIFFGDTIICESIGRTDLPTASTSNMTKSLIKIASLNIEKDTVCYFGHGYDMDYNNLISKNIYLRKYLK